VDASLYRFAVQLSRYFTRMSLPNSHTQALRALRCHIMASMHHEARAGLGGAKEVKPALRSRLALFSLDHIEKEFLFLFNILQKKLHPRHLG